MDISRAFLLTYSNLSYINYSFFFYNLSFLLLIKYSLYFCLCYRSAINSSIFVPEVPKNILLYYKMVFYSDIAISFYVGSYLFFLS